MPYVYRTSCIHITCYEFYDSFTVLDYKDRVQGFALFVTLYKLHSSICDRNHCVHCNFGQLLLCLGYFVKLSFCLISFCLMPTVQLSIILNTKSKAREKRTLDHQKTGRRGWETVLCLNKKWGSDTFG